MNCVMLPQGWAWQDGRLLTSLDGMVVATLFEGDDDERALEELACVCDGVLPDTDDRWESAVTCAAIHERLCVLREMEQALAHDVDDDWLVERANTARALRDVAREPSEVACHVSANANGMLSFMHRLPLGRILRHVACSSETDISDRVRNAMFEVTYGS